MSSGIESQIVQLIASTLAVDPAMLRRDATFADLGEQMIEYVTLALALKEPTVRSHSNTGGPVGLR
jgi:hypothetical protein